jgi:hypothetical protein
VHRKLEKSEIDHDAGKDVKENVCDVITQGVEFPNSVINGITEHADGLISIPTLKREYFLDPLPIQIPDGRILVNHPIIPIGELVPQRIEVEYGDQ